MIRSQRGVFSAVMLAVVLLVLCHRRKGRSVAPGSEGERPVTPGSAKPQLVSEFAPQVSVSRVGETKDSSTVPPKSLCRRVAVIGVVLWISIEKGVSRRGWGMIEPPPVSGTSRWRSEAMLLERTTWSRSPFS